MRSYSLDCLPDLWALSLTHFYFYIHQQIFALDLETLRTERVGGERRYVIDMRCVGDCRLLILVHPHDLSDDLRAVLLNEVGTPLWSRPHAPYACVGSSLFQVGPLVRPKLEHVDLATGATLQTWTCDYFHVFDRGILTQRGQTFQWINEDGTSSPTLPFQHPELFLAVDGDKRAHVQADGSILYVGDEYTVLKKEGNYLKKWKLPGRLGRVDQAFVVLGRDFVICTDLDDPVSVPILSPFSNFHFRRHGMVYKHWSLGTVPPCNNRPFSYGTVMLHDHRPFRACWILLGLSRVLPEDLVRLMMAYAIA